jgi:hypothetical protein
LYLLLIGEKMAYLQRVTYASGNITRAAFSGTHLMEEHTDFAHFGEDGFYLKGSGFRHVLSIPEDLRLLHGSNFLHH